MIYVTTREFSQSSFPAVYTQARRNARIEKTHVNLALFNLLLQQPLTPRIIRQLQPALIGVIRHIEIIHDFREIFVGGGIFESVFFGCADEGEAMFEGAIEGLAVDRRKGMVIVGKGKDRGECRDKSVELTKVARLLPIYPFPSPGFSVDLDRRKFKLGEIHLKGLIADLPGGTDVKE